MPHSKSQEIVRSPRLPRLPSNSNFTTHAFHKDLRFSPSDVLFLSSKKATPSDRFELLEALGETERCLQFFGAHLHGMAVKATATPFGTKWTKLVAFVVEFGGMVEMFLKNVVRRKEYTQI